MNQGSNNAGQLYNTVVLALLPVQLLILTPVSLYLNNLAEMNVGLGAVLRACLIPALFLWLGLYLLYRISREKARAWWVLSLSCLSLLVWIQGNLIVWDYGVFDGRNIEWAQYKWRGWVDLAIWLGVLVAGIWLMKDRLRLLSTICIVLVSSQAISILVALVQSEEELEPKADFVSQNDYVQLHQFSKQQNVIHLIVDGFQADVFDFLMTEESVGPAYREAFSGFTFYRENLGVYPYTRFSVPAFLSGEIYKNSAVKDRFIDTILSGKNILNQAKLEGFSLDIASGSSYWVNRYASANYDHIYSLDEDISVNPVHRQSATLIDIALFRSAPHFLKPYIYDKQKWFSSKLFAEAAGGSELYFKHTRFLNSLIRRMEISREEPVYKYFHIMNTHNPMVVDASCQYRGEAVRMSRDTLTYQSNCTMGTLSLLLERFKALGIYDSSLIVIQGDHGGWVGNYRQGPAIEFPNGAEGPEWIKSLASPLLVIKPPQAEGEFETSDQLTSLVQVPNSISEIMGWEKQYSHLSISDSPDVQQQGRSFYFYDWQRNAWEADYTGPIFQFDISGSHYESPWLLSDVFHPPE